MSAQLVLGSTLTEHSKFMISSDHHFPWQNDRAIKIWFDVMKWYKPQQVDYLGDTSDQLCYSRYNDGSTDEFFNKIKKTPDESPMPFVLEEEKLSADFYEKTRKMLPDADIFVALGNHDIRVFDYMDKKAPAWIKEVTPENLWKLDDLGISYIYYNDLPKRRWGNVYAHHGVSAVKNAGDSVRSDIENFGVSLIRGHSHRAAYVPKTYELRNEVIEGYEIGHMADTQSRGMAYTNVHNWQLAFMIGHYFEGVPYFTLVPIREAADRTLSCVVDGKLFTA